MSDKKMAISNFGISIEDPEIMAKLEKKKISPSLITGLTEECPAKWVASNFLLKDLIQETPVNAASRGSLYHRVKELFFREPKEERTRERLGEIKKIVLMEEEFSFFAEIPEALQWLDNAIDSYYAMGGRPERVDVATIELDGEEHLGLEVFVQGNLADASRPTLGFIDRVVHDSRKGHEGELVIEDWKSGAKAKEWNPKTKSTDGLAEARQQTIYALMLEEQGIEVGSARLIYPVAKKIVQVDVKDKAMRELSLEGVRAADEALDNYIETNEFDYSPSIFCNWCPLVNICSKAETANFEKARAARRQAPGIEVLAEGFDFV